MAFRPSAHDTLHIDGLDHAVAEHPAAPGIPYGQEGRAAVVYRLLAEETGEARAFKVFKPRFQTPSLVGLSERLEAFASLPGLQVCHRRIITARRNLELVRKHPGLNYAVLMPWIEGPTWMEVLLEDRVLSPEQSLTLARALTEILDHMEERGAAHCDLSGPNLLLPILAEDGRQTTDDRQSAIELVDVEQMFGEDLKRPEFVPAGSSGYAHRSAAEGQWNARADRFAGALLISEMLGWCDKRIRDASWGESYFDPEEMQQDTDRYHLLLAVLEERWGEDVAHLLEQSWESDSLADCATFGQWLAALPDQPRSNILPASEARLEAVQPVALPQLSVSPAKAGEAGGLPQYIREMLDEARRFEEKGNLESAIATYREVLSMAPAGSGLATEMPVAISQLEAKQRLLAAPTRETGPDGSEPKPVSKPPEQIGNYASPGVTNAVAESKEAPPQPPQPPQRQQQPNIPNTQVQMPGISTPTSARGPQYGGAWVGARDGAGRVSPPIAPAASPRYIDKLFDEAFTAYQLGQLASASDLLAEVVRQQGNYARNGQSAAALLADTNRRLGRVPATPTTQPPPASNYPSYPTAAYTTTPFVPAAVATPARRRSPAPWIAALLLLVLFGGAATLWSLGVFGGQGQQNPASPTTTAIVAGSLGEPTQVPEEPTTTTAPAPEDIPTLEPTSEPAVEPTLEPTTEPTAAALDPTATIETTNEPTPQPDTPTPSGPSFGPMGVQTPISVSASSNSAPSFDSNKNETTYVPTNATDGNKETTWRVDGDGRDQYLELQFAQPVRISTIRLIPGYTKVDPVDKVDRFKQNRRVKLVRFQFDDGSYTDGSFADDPSFQNTQIASVVTRSVIIVIEATYPPNPPTGVLPRDYTPISEVEVVGEALLP